MRESVAAITAEGIKKMEKMIVTYENGYKEVYSGSILELTDRAAAFRLAGVKIRPVEFSWIQYK